MGGRGGGGETERGGGRERAAPRNAAPARRQRNIITGILHERTIWVVVEPMMRLRMRLCP